MKSKSVAIGPLVIGGGSSIVVQTMCNKSLNDIQAIIKQVHELADEGAELVRFSVRNMNEADNINMLVKAVAIPLCADIHFDYKLAIKAIDSGVVKIRINPGNIGSSDNVQSIVAAAKQNNVAIRVGVNGGSIDRKRYPGKDSDALVASALDQVTILEKFGFNDIVISIKSSDVLTTIAANRLLRQKNNYPIHLGLTEAGFGHKAVVKSSIAIGALLLDNIGDTIRVSMTGDPLQEVGAAYEILRAVKKIDYGVDIISCPTCGRTDSSIDLEVLARAIDQEINTKYIKHLKRSKKTISIAVMGCEVNGPGEAKDADIGVAICGRGQCAIFNNGFVKDKVNYDQVVAAVTNEVASLLKLK